MKKKNYINAISLILSICFLIGICGCRSKKDIDNESSSNDSYFSMNEENSDIMASSSENSTGNKSTTTKNNTAEKNTPQNVKVVNNCYTSGLKIAKDPITFKVMVKDQSGGTAKYDDSSFANYVKEKMNISLKFEVTNESTFSEKLVLSYSSGKMPDMFWGMAPATYTHNPYIKKGDVIEVGKYLNSTYAPNILKMFKDYPSSKYVTTYDDGKTYMIPMVNANDKFGHSLFINKTWLKNLGLQIPKNTDEFHDVLYKFKEQDANKNGNKNDEIPMMVCGEINPSLYGPWGINTYWNGWSLDESGKVIYAYTTENYRNALRFYNRLFSEGLLDKNLKGTVANDIYTRASAAVQTVGVFTGEDYQKYCSDESFYKNYTIMPLLTVNGTKPRYYYNDYESVWAEWCVLTKNCKYPECAVRLVDHFYSTDGAMLAREGAPGKDGLWDYDSNGKIVMQLDKKPSRYKTIADWNMSRTPGYCLPHYASSEFYSIINSANVSTNHSQYLAQKNAVYSKVDKSTAFPKIYIPDVQNAKLSKEGDVASVRSDYFWQFLSGTSSLDTEWNVYVNQLNKIGLKDMTAIYNNSYNQYRVWLQKNK